MRIPVQPSKVQLQGPYNSQAKQHEPPGTTVYHLAMGDQPLQVTDVAVANDPLPESGRDSYRGGYRAPHAGELPTIARCPNPGFLGSSSWYAIRDLTTDAPEEAPAAEPKARSARPITGEPRIVCLVDGHHRDANSEGCMVVVDDVEAIAVAVASGKYHGPPGPPDLDYVTYPAKLPRRRYLSTVSPGGVPAEMPRYENGAARWNLTSFSLTHGLGTIFATWEEAQQAIAHAREAGLVS